MRLRDGDPLDARDTTVTGDHLKAVLDALQGGGQRATLTGADFRGATLAGNLRLDGVTFARYARFEEATFDGNARFDGATFDGNARFDGATFNGNARFDGATFNGNARFGKVTFSGNARFGKATFSGYAVFESATFSGYARFDGATFTGDARFDDSIFAAADARFDGVAFGGDSVFDGATFGGNARFSEATFERVRELGRFVVRGHLVFDDCVFSERVSIEVVAIGLSARGTTFGGGVRLRVGYAEIALDDADFVRPSTLSPTTWTPESDVAVCILDARHIELQLRPRLITLRGANIALLAVSDVDIRACRFFGAHGLESLRIEASCQWAATPAHWRSRARDTIAEEHQWRSDSTSAALGSSLRREGADGPANWNTADMQAPDWLEHRDGPAGLDPRQIAAVYRALRQSREDNKDEAGAGDLYYGEMEMRRHSRRPGKHQRGSAHSRGDRLLLTIYWVISGYGMRPVRALASLALALIVGAAVLHWYGFHEEINYGRALLFAAESSLSILKAPDANLSAGGQVVQLSLRLLGPLFFGLALLAVRARVKR